ncbi:Uncharacterised protein [uncultured archaeon]|nr:Uncharacterised protein [uncultured archaeon]
MKKIAIFVVYIMLATSFMGIFSIECIAQSPPQAQNDITAPVITTVTGLFYNVQQSTFTVSFYAIRIRYWTTGPFRHENGIINLKSCTGGMIIGPIKMTWIGPLHNFAYGTFTFLGDIYYNRNGFRQGFTNTSPTM